MQCCCASAWLGTNRMLRITLHCLQTLCVDKVPTSKGFGLHEDPDVDADASLEWQVQLSPQEGVLLPVTWAPAALGPESQQLVFNLDGRHRVQVKLVGTCVAKPVTAAPRSRLTADQRLKRVMQQVAATSGRLKPAAAAAGAQPAPEHDAYRSMQAPGKLAARRVPLVPPAVGAPAGALAHDQSEHGKAGGGGFKPPPPPRTMSGAAPSKLHLRRPTPGAAGAAAPTSMAPPPPVAGRTTGLAPRGASALQTPGSSAGLQTPRATLAAPRAPSARPAAGTRPSSPAASEDSFHSAAAPSRAGGSTYQSASARRAALGLPRPGSAASSRSGSVAGSLARGGGLAARVPAGSTSKSRKTFSFFHTE